MLWTLWAAIFMMTITVHHLNMTLIPNPEVWKILRGATFFYIIVLSITLYDSYV